MRSSRSSAPGLLLLPRSSPLPVMPHLPPAHYERNKRDSPHKIRDKGKTTETLRVQIQISTCQCLITYQIKVLTIWFLIRPLPPPSYSHRRPSSHRSCHARVGGLPQGQAAPIVHGTQGEESCYRRPGLGCPQIHCTGGPPLLGPMSPLDPPHREGG
jgi:hypothetical protein